MLCSNCPWRTNSLCMNYKLRSTKLTDALHVFCSSQFVFTIMLIWQSLQDYVANLLVLLRSKLTWQSKCSDQCTGVLEKRTTKKLDMCWYNGDENNNDDDCWRTSPITWHILTTIIKIMERYICDVNSACSNRRLPYVKPTCSYAL